MMVQPKPRLTKCITQAFTQTRSFHTRPTPYEPSIAHLLDKGPQDVNRVVVNGFIRSIRNQKQVSFASIGDGTTLKPLQALLTPDLAQRSELLIPFSNIKVPH